MSALWDVSENNVIVNEDTQPNPESFLTAQIKLIPKKVIPKKSVIGGQSACFQTSTK